MLTGLAVWHGDALNYSQAWRSLTSEMWQELIDWHVLEKANSPRHDWDTFTGMLSIGENSLI